MKIYDISQEVFTCCVYPGDPSPERQVMMRIPEGAVCNLTAFRMCAHNGTHVDAPFHFIQEGRTIDGVALERFIGYAYVAEHSGELTAADAEAILEAARCGVGVLCTLHGASVQDGLRRGVKPLMNAGVFDAILLLRGPGQAPQIIMEKYGR